MIHELNTNLANSSKWMHRQAFVLLCEKIVQNESMPYSTFIDEMLRHLLNASLDQVPNVRIVLSRCISQTLWPIAQFRSHDRVQQTMEDLQDDKDEDVRKFGQTPTQCSAAL